MLKTAFSRVVAMCLLAALLAPVPSAFARSGNGVSLSMTATTGNIGSRAKIDGETQAAPAVPMQEAAVAPSVSATVEAAPAVAVESPVAIATTPVEFKSAPVVEAQAPAAPDVKAPVQADVAVQPPVMAMDPVPAPAPVAVAAPGAAAVHTAADTQYRLDAGDRIRMTVFGEPDLSGEFAVDGKGTISLPLIGNIEAKGVSVREFEHVVEAKLADGYLVKPHVSAEVMNYRPFSILGEVIKPGSYPYVNDMTVVNAVALAGGYTYRANKTGATIVRAADPAKSEKAVSEDAIVMPGDVVRVPERFF